MLLRLDSREGNGEGESLPQVDAHEGDVGNVVDSGGAPGGDGSEQRGQVGKFRAALCIYGKNTSLLFALCCRSPSHTRHLE